MAEEREHYKYKVRARVQKLRLNKNLNFETRITWKRNVNKAETRSVTHQDCESIFDEQLELELNLIYNHASSKFQPKMTEFTVVVIYQGKIKSGGHVKYDAAEIVNNNYENQPVQLNLLQCPDPGAYIQVIFNYEVVGECSRSLFNQLSMLNPSGFQQDLSQLDFKEEDTRRQSDHSIQKESLKPADKTEELPLKESEMQKISNILDKFESVSRKLASNHKSVFSDSTKNESQQLSEQEERLRVRVTELQNELQLKNELVDDYQKRIKEGNRKIEELQLKLELADQKTQEFMKKKENQVEMTLLAESQQKYKSLYQQSLKEIEELQEQMNSAGHFSKQNHKFQQFLEEAHDIDEVPQFQIGKGNTTNDLTSKIDQLQRENVELQTKIASTSHNIAQLFNAAYDYGGPKLLDYLQGSIGLIEQQS